MRQRQEDIAFLGFSAPRTGPRQGGSLDRQDPPWRLGSVQRASSGRQGPGSSSFPSLSLTVLPSLPSGAPRTPAGPWHGGHLPGSCWGDGVCPQLGPHCKPSHLSAPSFLCVRRTTVPLHAFRPAPLRPAGSELNQQPCDDCRQGRACPGTLREVTP